MALTLLALVIAMVGSGGGLLSRSRDVIERNREDMIEATSARAVLSDRLQSALHLMLSETGSQKVAFEGEADRVRFASLRPDYERGHPLTAIELAIESEEGAGAVTLRMAAMDPAEIDLEMAEIDEERRLLRFEGKSRLAYMRPGEDSEDAPTWEPVWQGEARLPMAVRLELGESEPPIIVPLRMTLPPLCAVDNEDLLLEITGCDFL